MDSGAAGHVMRKGMIPRVKFERKTAPPQFVAGNGEQIRDRSIAQDHETNNLERRRASFGGSREGCQAP